ncbi:hypothetical protein D0Y65_015227, partial [Glycine soja]
KGTFMSFTAYLITLALGRAKLGDARAEVPEKKAKEKYIAPHLRARAGNEPEEHTQIRIRVRGLLNRLSESNVESITGELSLIFQVCHS